MSEETLSSPATEPVASPVETPTVTPPVPDPAPVETPVVPAESASVPEPVQPAPPTPTPVPVAPTPPPVEPLVAAVSPIRQLLEKAKAKIQFRKSAKLDKIMVKAREQGSIGNDEAQKLLRVSDATATRYLVQLVREGRLKRVGHPRHARYEPAN